MQSVKCFVLVRLIATSLFRQTFTKYYFLRVITFLCFIETLLYITVLLLLLLVWLVTILAFEDVLSMLLLLPLWELMQILRRADDGLKQLKDSSRRLLFNKISNVQIDTVNEKHFSGRSLALRWFGAIWLAGKYWMTNQNNKERHQVLRLFMGGDWRSKGREFDTRWIIFTFVCWKMFEH